MMMFSLNNAILLRSVNARGLMYSAIRGN